LFSPPLWLRLSYATPHTSVEYLTSLFELLSAPVSEVRWFSIGNLFIPLLFDELLAPTTPFSALELTISNNQDLASNLPQFFRVVGPLFLRPSPPGSASCFFFYEAARVRPVLEAVKSFLLCSLRYYFHTFLVGALRFTLRAGVPPFFSLRMSCSARFIGKK